MGEAAEIKQDQADAAGPEVAKETGADAGNNRHPEQQMVPTKEGGEMVVSVKMLYQTTVVVALACSLLSVFMYDRFFATKIAVFDYPDFLIKVRNAVISGAISQDQLKTYMEMAEAKIKSQPRNYVVLSGDVLLGDGKGAKKISEGIDIPKAPLQPSTSSQNIQPGLMPMAPQQQGLQVPGFQQGGGAQMPQVQGQ